ncbi:MAG TPA: tetratricopeptide repeat protein [Blastocatellia bacterium]|nr:tetratricopeptide repeat protein [Blastocatellia bacterium]
MKTVNKKTTAASKHSRAGQATASAQAKGPFSILEQLGAVRIVMLVSLFAFLAYANALGGDFVFDDNEQIVENQDIRSWGNVARGFTTDVWSFREKGDSANVPAPLPYYRPLFTAMLTVEYQLFGERPQLWHLVSLLLHIVCSIEIFYIILLLSGRLFVAMTCALLFAVHPVHTESVSWISGMTDPLFGVFFLAALYFYLKQRDERSDPSRRRKRLLYSLAFFVIAAFAKETALSLAILIFGYEVAVSSDGAKRRLVEAAKRAMPFVAASMIYLIPRYVVLGERMLSNPQAPDRPLAYTLLTLPFVVASYLLHLIWPIGLSVTYDTRFITNVASASFILPAMVIAAIVGLLIYFRRKINRQVWVALLLIFVPLLPVLNLGQVSQEQYLVFDHYLYLSVAGLGYLAGLALSKLAEARSEKLSLAVAAAIVLALAVGTHFENRAWADSYAVWSNAARVSPNYWATQYNTALELIKLRQYGEARDKLERAASLKPDEPMIYDALGRAYMGLGDFGAAEAQIKHALELNPEMFESLNNLGTVYFEAKDYAKAERYFMEALRANPQAAATRFNLAQSYARTGDNNKAARRFEEFLQLSPGDAEAHYELGLVYERMGRATEAARAFERGLELARSQELKEKINKSLNGVKR